MEKRLNKFNVVTLCLVSCLFNPISAFAITTSGLSLFDSATIYDANQDVYWLRNTNLAGDSSVRSQMGVPGIYPNGTMDSAAAWNWVYALNHYDHNKGYLGHHDWQLPVTPPIDSTCAVLHGNDQNSFGPSCIGSALGNLYRVGLMQTYPNSILPNVKNTIGNFQNIQPSLYWSLGSNGSGIETFSFTTDTTGSNTKKYNYFYPLPMITSAIGDTPPGKGVLPYLGGKVLYDSYTGYSWLADANLAATNNFGITGKTSINGYPDSVPLIASDGAMLFSVADTGYGTFTYEMNKKNYLGTASWQLAPSSKDLLKLFKDMGITPGDTEMAVKGNVGPFKNLQPFFYWSCQRDQNGNSKSACSTTSPGIGMEWSFNFGSGFQGTDLNSKKFYVMVYYPGKKVGAVRQGKAHNLAEVKPASKMPPDQFGQVKSILGRRENSQGSTGYYYENKSETSEPLLFLK